MQNGILKMDWGTIADAAIMAALFAVIAAMATIVGSGNFDLFTADWATIGHNMANVSFIAGFISLSQGILSTNKGSVLNVTPERAVG